MGIFLDSIHILRKIPQRHFTRGSVLMKMKNAPRTKPLVKSRSMTTNVLISVSMNHSNIEISVFIFSLKWLSFKS